MNESVPQEWPRWHDSFDRQVVTTLLCLAFLCPLATAGEPRPNIVFVFSDDHAVQSIGAYGSRINQTPNIDRIAAEGAVFTNSFCANSLCGPSRACILTGKHSHLNGFLRNGNRFDSMQTTFPPLLRQAGYQTALIGKWHLGTDPVGFDYWEILPGQGSYYNPDFVQMDGSRVRREGYCTDVVTDRSIKWLEDQRDPQRPFLLMCQHKAPHRNWAPAIRHLKLFANQTVPEPATLRDDYSRRSELLQENEMSIRAHMDWGHDMKFHGECLFPDHFTENQPNGEYERMNAEQRAAWDAHYEPENQAFIAQLKAGNLSNDQVLSWKYQRYIKDYLRCIAAVDESVGRLLDYLDKAGLTEKTVFIYASDQGFYLGEHGWYDKRWMFEESLRMPFLIRWPGVVTAGARFPQLIQNIDYAPTFLKMAQLDVPDEMQGQSLTELFDADTAKLCGWRDAIYYAYYENDAVHNAPVQDGVRTDRYKLIFFPRTREWQLFDLKSDPQEMVSVHDDPVYAKVLAGMQKRYRDLREFYTVNTAVIPTSRGDEAWWRDRFREGQQPPGGPVDLVFLGDSITQGWEGAGEPVWKKHFSKRQALNWGFSGDRTEHVLWRLQQHSLATVSPQLVLLMIGTNNTGHLLQDPAEVADGVERIVETIRQQSPNTRVLLHGIFPRGQTPVEKERLNNIAINQMIQRLADGESVVYADFSPAFLAADGTISPEIMPDYLHLSREGYERWAHSLEPLLQDFGL